MKSYSVYEDSRDFHVSYELDCYEQVVEFNKSYEILKCSFL